MDYYEDHFPVPYTKAMQAAHQRLTRLLGCYRLHAADAPPVHTNFITIREICKYIWKDFPMAKRTAKTGQRNTNSREGFQPVQWVNVPLSDDAVPAIQEFYADDYQTAGYLLAMCVFATNVFVKYDEKTASYCAGLIAPDEKVEGRVMGVSGWSDNPLDAVRALLYKWYHVLGECWPDEVEKPRSHFR
jgi:hypothetical protein